MGDGGVVWIWFVDGQKAVVMDWCGGGGGGGGSGDGDGGVVIPHVQDGDDHYWNSHRHPSSLSPFLINIFNPRKE